MILKPKLIEKKWLKVYQISFELEYEDTLNKISSDNSFVIIAKKVEKDKVDRLREWMKKEEIYTGINIDEDTKRYYPYDNLTSSLIGFVMMIIKVVKVWNITGIVHLLVHQEG